MYRHRGGSKVVVIYSTLLPTHSQVSTNEGVVQSLNQMPLTGINVITINWFVYVGFKLRSSGL
jgi:hypothetical protein